MRIKSGKYHERKRHFVTISPCREHQAREALCGHFPQCEITARSHEAGERACTHGGAFDRAESGVLRASLRKLITLNLRYRSIGRTDRPTDRPGARRKAEGRYIRRRTEILPCFVPNETRVCPCIYGSVIPSDFGTTTWLSLFVRYRGIGKSVEMVESSLSLRRARRNLRLQM